MPKQARGMESARKLKGAAGVKKERKEFAKIKWNANEDRVLTEIMRMSIPLNSGSENWTRISKLFNERVNYSVYRHPKQCRERWIHFLNPALDKSHLTPEEEEFALTMADKLNHKWTKITELFYDKFGKRKSSNSLKNLYHTKRRSTLKKCEDSEDEINVAEVAISLDAFDALVEAALDEVIEDVCPSAPERNVCPSALERNVCSDSSLREFVPFHQMERVFPTAPRFTTPNVPSWMHPKSPEPYREERQATAYAPSFQMNRIFGLF